MARGDWKEMVEVEKAGRRVAPKTQGRSRNNRPFHFVPSLLIGQPTANLSLGQTQTPPWLHQVASLKSYRREESFCCIKIFWYNFARYENSLLFSLLVLSYSFSHSSSFHQLICFTFSLAPASSSPNLVLASKHSPISPLCLKTS